MKKSILRLFAVSTLFLLLLNPSLSLEGAKNGLLLWFNTVLPTLLPFMLCSNAIVVSGAVPVLTAPFFPVLSRLGLSRQGSYALLSGLLCGYPMGPKTTADLLQSRSISLSEAKLLLAVSAWPSPMFLSGYLRSFLEPSVSFPLVLASVYLPLLPLSLAAGRLYGVRKASKISKRSSCQKTDRGLLRPSEPLSPGASFPGDSERSEDTPSFDGLMMNCLEIMAKIGVYLMIFSILAVFLGHFSPPGSFLGPCLLGAVEMTTGIREIAASMTGVPAAAAMLGSAVFGGLSGIFQVSAVIGPRKPHIEKNAGLSIRHYVLWKLAHLVLSTALFILLSSPG